MQLPQSLAPWSTYLNLLAAPLPFSLGPTVKCLELVFGPSRAALTTESDDEPEGYDGIARKGTYERLVLSEWLLADEFPDEFLRRSSVGEHSFLELTRKSPSGAKKTTALFDCGPNQLGSPRIAHLAILIVLARRAELNDTEVEWGVLQDAQSALFSGAGKESIERLLSSRTVHDVTDKDIARWFDATADKSVVIIGGARISKLIRRRQATLLTIEDILEPEQNALSASYVGSAGNRRAEFILPLPPEKDCVQILQNPFEITEKARQNELQAPTDWELVASGDFFVARQSPTSVISLRVPISARHHGVRQRTYILRSDAAVVAAGASVANSALAMLTISPQKEIQVVLIGGKNLPGYFTHHLHTKSDQKQQCRNSEYLTSIFPSPDLEDSVWVLVGDKILEIPTRSGKVLSSVIAKDVFWLTRSRGTISGTRQDVLVYAMTFNGRYQAVIVGLETGEQISFTVPGRPLFCSPSQILIAYRDARLGIWGFASYPPSNAVADPIHDRQFLSGETPVEMAKVVSRSSSSIGLIVISKDKRDLHIVSSGDPNRWRLPQAASTIRSVAVNGTGVIAYITDRAELTLVWPDSKWQRLVFDGHRFQNQWRDDDYE
ncbi:MAG: hypothetical protein SGJ27_11045 [Candidatus Melainabacteria bacterium]|nr:hypothetical protein [Candidatus Melainabacteria bacterium]